MTSHVLRMQGILVALRYFRLLVTLSLLMSAASFVADCAEVILIRNHSVDQPVETQIRTLVDFYGLNLRAFDLEREPIGTIPVMPKGNVVVAVLISQDALGLLPRRSLEIRLLKNDIRRIPVLIFGIVSSSNEEQLKLWSGGAIDGCLPKISNTLPESLVFGKVPRMTRTLRRWRLPAVTAPSCALHERPTAESEDVLRLEGHNRSDALLVRTAGVRGEVFFTPAVTMFDRSWAGDPRGLTGVFSSLAPLIVFMSYVAEDYKWHLDGNYANLTIDDPWLKAQYGHLNYTALLTEMRQHKFHTTIAFIPWNFDRSNEHVSSMFRNNPAYFSIAIHGNNHIHQEFAAYTAVPLSEQIQALKKALARMERFQYLTGIPYDRFMVFPHAIAPERTLIELKRYNFLGTANSSDVPLDRATPSQATFLLRPYSRDYGSFLTLFRYPAGEQTERAEIAINCFMGNPLLFYGHEDLFFRGIGTFDELADFINRTQPDTRWTSLGELARHVYLIRRRDTGGFQVQMFSNEMDLKNPENEDAEFQIECEEDLNLPISSVTIDGFNAPVTRSPKRLTIAVTIPANQIRRIRICYQNDLDFSRIDIRKVDWRVKVIRNVSDFRDLYLSNISWGRGVKHTYYREHWDSLELALENRWLLTLFYSLLIAAGLTYILRKVARRHRLRSAQNG